jgi:hypothetical protein
MWKQLARVLLLGILLTTLLSGAGPTLAQDYTFGVPELRMQVYVQPDASARIVYDITFENYGAPIDIVDIGLPHKDYDFARMSASINGAALTDIRTSEYIDIGVEIHLRDQAIPTGETGTLHFEATMPDMVYQDTTDRDLASMRITPTWFDDDLVRGEGAIRIAIHLPEGVEPDEALYQQEPFTGKALYEGRTVVVWEWEAASATRAYMVGVSFPQRVMSRVIRMTLIDLINQWLEDNPQAAVIMGIACLGLLAWLFFRWSGGTGCTVFAILAGGMLILFVVSPILMLPTIPLLIGLVLYNESRLKKKKPNSYLPPLAQTEGGGIKRGLTAPEAATLLEMPLNKVLTLVIFGLLEKKILVAVKDEPLTVRVREPFQTWDDEENRRSIKKRRTERRHAAQREGTVIHDYENDFLDQIERTAEKPVSKIDFTKPMEKLIKATADKMKGFDLSDTQDYYRRVMERAMAQAASIGEIEMREQYLDKYLPWVMMNESYPTVLRHGGYHYWPTWARPVRPAGTSGVGQPRTASSQSGGPARGGKTTFGDVAGSFSGWAENTMGGLSAAILPASMNLPNARGGFVDLSGVDRVTGDVFEAISKASSKGGGGGSGGSCACACAGCACACACAGGGR